jgi:hypothetical protein
MTVLSWVATVFVQIPDALPKDAPKKFDQFVKIAVPLLSALVPALLAAAFKWLQDHDRQRRRADLIEHLSKLAKNISELPELPESSGDAMTRMRSALNVEMESVLRELNLLQTHVPRRVIGIPGVSSIASRLKLALLLFRPKGVAAWLLHLAFFGSCLFLAFMSLGLFASSSDASTTPTSPGIVLTIYIILGIPPLIFRHFAVRIHRRQCAQLETAAASAVNAPLSSASAAPHV